MTEEELAGCLGISFDGNGLLMRDTSRIRLSNENIKDSGLRIHGEISPESDGHIIIYVNGYKLLDEEDVDSRFDYHISASEFHEQDDYYDIEVHIGRTDETVISYSRLFYLGDG